MIMKIRNKKKTDARDERRAIKMDDQRSNMNEF